MKIEHDLIEIAQGRLVSAYALTEAIKHPLISEDDIEVLHRWLAGLQTVEDGPALEIIAQKVKG